MNRTLLQIRLILIVFLSLNGCNLLRPNPPQGQTACQSTRPAQTAAQVISILHQDLNIVKNETLKNPEELSIWQEKNSFMTDQGGGGIITELTITPSIDFNVGRYIVNPVKVPSGEEIHGFFLAKSLWSLPHSLRFLFLMDFEQMPVLSSEENGNYFERSAVEPGEELGFEFLISALPDGFHQLSILIITDPSEQSLDDIYRLTQRSSFQEIRVDIWAGIQSLPPSVQAFENERAAEGAFVRITQMDLVELDEKGADRVTQQLEFKTGEERCLRLKLYNCGINCRQESPLDRQYDGILPLEIGVFWDDSLEQVLAYGLEANAPDFQTIQLNIKAPVEPGSHQLNLVALSIPGFSQFDPHNSLERAAYPKAIFSRRVLVEVTK